MLKLAERQKSNNSTELKTTIHQEIEALRFDKKIFTASDSIMRERDLRDFLFTLELHHTYQFNEYLKLVKFWDYFSLEKNQFLHQELIDSLKPLWEAFDSLVMFLRFEFSEVQEGKKTKKELAEFMLDPAGYRYLRDAQAQKELRDSTENRLQSLIMKTRDSYRLHRSSVRKILHV